MRMEKIEGPRAHAMAHRPALVTKEKHEALGFSECQSLLKTCKNDHLEAAS